MFMRMRKQWIVLLVMLALLAAGCSQAPKMVRVAGTIVDRPEDQCQTEH